MSGTPCNCCRSGGESSGCFLAAFNVLVVDIQSKVYLDGAHELVDIIKFQNNIAECDVMISKNDPFASTRACAVSTFGKAKRVRTELIGLVGLKEDSLPSYTGLPQVNSIINAQWEHTQELYNGTVELCNLQIVNTELLAQTKNECGHKQDQIRNNRQAWIVCEPTVCTSFVAEVRDLNMYNCQNTRFLEAHGSPAKRATVCLYGISILFVLVSFGDNFVKKSEVTTLMHVGNDGPAFKDTVKFLKHFGVILDERGKF